MNDFGAWLALILGVALGAMAALVWRARREQALRVELEVLRARLKSEEILSAEREQAAVRAREQLQGVFGELARDSLKSNSEVFLQLARERLAPVFLLPHLGKIHQHASEHGDPVREVLPVVFGLLIFGFERDRIPNRRLHLGK